MTIAVERITSALTEQHEHIESLMEAVVFQEGIDRQSAFDDLCRYLAAHKAAEEELIQAPAKEQLQGDTSVVHQPPREEDEVGVAMAELERLGIWSPDFRDGFEKLRQTVLAHAETAELQELPRLSATAHEADVTRMQNALSRVPDLASRNDANGASFRENLRAARAELRSWLPTAR